MLKLLFPWRQSTISCTIWAKNYYFLYDIYYFLDDLNTQLSCFQWVTRPLLRYINIDLLKEHQRVRVRVFCCSFFFSPCTRRRYRASNRERKMGESRTGLAPPMPSRRLIQQLFVKEEKLHMYAWSTTDWRPFKIYYFLYDLMHVGNCLDNLPTPPSDYIPFPGPSPDCEIVKECSRVYNVWYIFYCISIIAFCFSTDDFLYTSIQQRTTDLQIYYFLDDLIPL